MEYRMLQKEARSPGMWPGFTPRYSLCGFSLHQFHSLLDPEGSPHELGNFATFFFFVSGENYQRQYFFSHFNLFYLTNAVWDSPVRSNASGWEAPAQKQSWMATGFLPTLTLLWVREGSWESCRDPAKAKVQSSGTQLHQTSHPWDSSDIW